MLNKKPTWVPYPPQKKKCKFFYLNKNIRLDAIPGKDQKKDTWVARMKLTQRACYNSNLVNNLLITGRGANLLQSQSRVTLLKPSFAKLGKQTQVAQEKFFLVAQSDSIKAPVYNFKKKKGLNKCFQKLKKYPSSLNLGQLPVFFNLLPTPVREQSGKLFYNNFTGYVPTWGPLDPVFPLVNDQRSNESNPYLGIQGPPGWQVGASNAAPKTKAKNQTQNGRVLGLGHKQVIYSLSKSQYPYQVTVNNPRGIYPTWVGHVFPLVNQRSNESNPYLGIQGPPGSLGWQTQQILSNAIKKLKDRKWTENFITYNLETYHRSNQDTCLMHKPAIKEGDWIQTGDLLADSASSVAGELAIGHNIIVAYMPWEGYNYEDAILINERLVYEEIYTSIHIERYEIITKDTKLGFEEITRAIPDANDDEISHLDKTGIAKIGSWVEEGDILVGKTTPFNIKTLTPQQKLLYKIFDKEINTTKDSSLRAPKGIKANVIKVNILAKQKLSINTIITSTNSKAKTKQKENKQRKQTKNINLSYTTKVQQFRENPSYVHIYLAEKRKMQLGDKMAGRHGNKGIVSRILPRQDMPFLPDGTAIDIVLNPLGVPSRMNVGQIYECLLGLAGRYLGEHYKIPPFDEMYGSDASRSFVLTKLHEARKKTGLKWLFDPNNPGKIRLFDGRNGECFDQTVTVGIAYVLKLVHMVDDKMHMRSTGPYSLVTQQPLRGRSKQGGQRLGEMEVWAIEGYGAAFVLSEMLTIKSDDMTGRQNLWKNLIENKEISLGSPESFKVLVCELQALCLDIGLFRKNVSKPASISTKTILKKEKSYHETQGIRSNPNLIEIDSLLHLA